MTFKLDIVDIIIGSNNTDEEIADFVVTLDSTIADWSFTMILLKKLALKVAEEKKFLSEETEWDLSFFDFEKIEALNTKPKT